MIYINPVSILRNEDMSENGNKTTHTAIKAILPAIAITAVCAIITAPVPSHAEQNATTDVRILQMKTNENTNTNGNANTNAGNENTNSNGNANENGNKNDNDNTGNENRNDNKNDNGNGNTGNDNRNDNGNNGAGNGSTNGDNGSNNGSSNDTTNDGKKPQTPIEAVGSILQTGLTNIWLWIIVAIAAATGIYVEVKKRNGN